MDRLARDDGFTLIELIVVVAIMAVLLTLGATTMEWLLPETNVNTAAREVGTFVEDARDEAVLTGRSIRLEYQLGDDKEAVQSFRSIREPTPGEKDRFDEIESDLVLQDWTYLPNGVRLAGLVLGEDDLVESGFYAFVVQADGSVGSHVIQLVSVELQSFVSVEISALSHEANVTEGQATPLHVYDDEF